MARSVLISDIINRVRLKGDYENSSVFSDATMLAFVNEQIAPVYDLLVQTNAGYYEDNATIAVLANAAYATLPTTFYKLCRADVSTDGGTTWRKLRPVALTQINRYTQAGVPVGYRMQTLDRLYLHPVPSAACSVRVYYIPAAPVFAATSESWNGFSGYERLLIERVLLLCDQREERPLSDRLAVIDQIEREIKTAAATRDDAEPFYLQDHDEDHAEEPWH